MTKPIRFEADAAEEITAAYDWYEARTPGMGVAVVAALDDVLERVCDRPKSGALASGVPRSLAARRMLLTRFPYAVTYIEQPDEIVVVAFAHTARRPGYWRRRHKRRAGS